MDISQNFVAFSEYMNFIRKAFKDKPPLRKMSCSNSNQVLHLIQNCYMAQQEVCIAQQEIEKNQKGGTPKSFYFIYVYNFVYCCLVCNVARQNMVADGKKSGVLTIMSLFLDRDIFVFRYVLSNYLASLKIAVYKLMNTFFVQGHYSYHKDLEYILIQREPFR